MVEGALFGPRASPPIATSANANVVFEHVSPPLSEIAKVVMKVSQNLHSEMLMPVIGATLRGPRGTPQHQPDMPAVPNCSRAGAST